MPSGAGGWSASAAIPPNAESVSGCPTRTCWPASQDAFSLGLSRRNFEPVAKKRSTATQPHDDRLFDALQAYDELRAAVAEIEALAHAADAVELPWAGDREQRRALGRLGCYVALIAELARTTVDDAEKTAAELMKARRSFSDR